MDKKKNSRSRKYMLTINNPAEHEESHSNIKKKLCKYQVDYIAMCDETGSQGTYHTHVYVKYHNAIQFLTIKSMFPSANIATALGTSIQNRNYLLKSAPEHHKKRMALISIKIPLERCILVLTTVIHSRK